MKFYLIDNQIIVNKNKLIGQKEISVKTEEEGKEKHVPCVEYIGNNIKVSLNHPMLEQHFINFICLESENGYQIKYLKFTDKAEAEFNIINDKAICVYEYCNLHGIWKKNI